MVLPGFKFSFLNSNSMGVKILKQFNLFDLRCLKELIKVVGFS